MASKRETLLDYLQNTLLKSIVAGATYNTTVATVHRGVRSIRDMAEMEFPAIFIPGVTERRESITGIHFRGILEVNLVLYVKNTRNSLSANRTGIQKDLDELIEDVTKALEADRKQGERVFKTEITDVTTDHGDMQDTAGAVIGCKFHYATEGANP